MAIFNKNAKTQAEGGDESEKKEATAAQVSPKDATPGFRSVIVQPRISEKASHLSTVGKYIFVVAKSANKIEIKKAIEQSYKVKVTQVNIVNTEGKHRNYGRTSGKMSDFKKAIVTLAAGQHIEGATETI